MEPRDFFHCLEVDYDVEAQLAAIRVVLCKHVAADREFSEGIKRLENHARSLTGELSEQPEQEWIDRLHNAIAWIRPFWPHGEV